MISGNHANEELAAVSRCNKQQDEGPAAAAAKSIAGVPSSRHWPPSTESRIVRVSRVFGGKDRHSKVRTIKGLRDRRVRLSVQTAIQLYDLQDRLGLSQPSKVVDWLLDAAQQEIDKLPPLQFPPHAQDLVAHLQQPSSMVAPFSNGRADRAAADTAAAPMTTVDGDKRHCHAGIRGLMGLNSSPGLVNGAMPLAHGLYYTAGESWTNNNGSVVHDQAVSHGASSPTVAYHSPFSSLLSLAPGPPLVFYSPEGGGFAMKEAADPPFAVDNIDHHPHGQLSLSSARRSFLHPGGQGQD